MKSPPMYSRSRQAIVSDARAQKHRNPAKAGFFSVRTLPRAWYQDDATPAFGYNGRPLIPIDTLADRDGVPRFRQYPNRTTMQEINPINNLIKDLSERTDVLRGYL